MQRECVRPNIGRRSGGNFASRLTSRVSARGDRTEIPHDRPLRIQIGRLDEKAPPHAMLYGDGIEQSIAGITFDETAQRLGVIKGAAQEPRDTFAAEQVVVSVACIDLLQRGVIGRPQKGEGRTARISVCGRP